MSAAPDVRDEKWWTPAEILFTRAQVIWLLSNLQLLEVGQWPAAPGGVAYRRRERVPHGPFTGSMEVAVEVQQRLDAGGVDGELLRDYYCYRKPETALMRVYGGTRDELHRRVRRALQYVSGFGRKPCTYEDFVRAGWKVPRA